MGALSIDSLFDAAIQILVCQEKSLDICFCEGSVSIKFPTTRRLAEFLDVPHYYILPYFAMMEENNLVTRAERVGIMTTHEGTRKFTRMMSDSYAKEAQALLGEIIFKEIVRAALHPGS
ncbi:MAG TPA: hypothetical protein PKM50_03820 [Methanoregula sp.]|nr:hypothetical protein [Methanoregula sp.]